MPRSVKASTLTLVTLLGTLAAAIIACDQDPRLPMAPSPNGPASSLQTDREGQNDASSKAPPGIGRPVSPYLVEPVAFEFLDIAGGSELALGDDDSVEVRLGFTFDFLGRRYDSVFVNSNGNLTFGYANGEWSNENLDTTGFNDIIAPWWDDLSPNLAGTITVHTGGAARSHSFIVTYMDVAHHNLESSKQISFQVVLYEEDSGIVFSYLDAQFGVSEYDNGRSATIGVKGGPVTQWSHNEAAVPSASSLRFSRRVAGNGRGDGRGKDRGGRR